MNLKAKMAEKIPCLIIQYAKPWIKHGGILKKINRFGEKDVYSCVFDEDNNSTTGPCPVYIWDGKTIEVVSGAESFKYFPFES